MLIKGVSCLFKLKMMKNYQRLVKIFEEYKVISRISGVMSWDFQVFMPKNGFAAKEKQLIFLDDLQNKLIYQGDLPKIIADVSVGGLSELQKRNFFLIKKFVQHQLLVPQKLQEEFSKISLRSEVNWREARAKNNYKLFDKEFKKIVEILREIADIKSEAFSCTKYESLLDLYDAGRKEKDLDVVFAKLKGELPQLIDEIIVGQKNSFSLPKKTYREATQKKFFLTLMQKMGVNKNWCRLDEAVHPFCTGYKGDVRITTRYDKQDFLSAMFGVIHESGHALYDDGLPARYDDLLIGEDAGMALHESQSLFWEMQIARSKPFVKFLTPRVNKAFNLSLEEGELFSAINKVEKSFIRVEADEVTYPMHIILRYEIERDLINRKIETSQVPDIWGQKMKLYLGLDVANDSLGCLQDIHWSDGSLGYFPTYSLGSIYAAQIAEKAKAVIGGFDKKIEEGKFKEIVGFLKENIHQKGHSKNADDIVKDVCGKGCDADMFLGYLRSKYL